MNEVSSTSEPITMAARLRNIAMWHHQKANEAGKDNNSRDRDRHIAIRNQIRSNLNGTR